jgi:hypothetical protein
MGIGIKYYATDDQDHYLKTPEEGDIIYDERNES